MVPFQLSIDKCLPEETITKDEQITIIVNDNVAKLSVENENVKQSKLDESKENTNEIKTIAAKRPNTLLVNRGSECIYSERKHLKHLYRSNSSSLHKRSPKLVSPTSITANDKYKLSRELDRIYFISSNKDDENYDSIEVIDERRRKNLPKSEHSRLYKSNTFICEEYYSNSQQQRQQQQIQEQKQASQAPTANDSESKSSVNEQDTHKRENNCSSDIEMH